MVYLSSFAPRVPPKVSVFELLFEHRRPYDENKAIFVDAFDKNNSYSCKDVKRMVQRAAAGLTRTFDLQKGDVVSIYSPNTMLYPIVFHGIVAAGGVVATMDHIWSAECLAYDMDLVQTKVLITHTSVLDRALDAAKRNGIDESRVLVLDDKAQDRIRTVQQVLLDHGELGEPVKYRPEEVADTVAYLYFTSGTTGHQKAVMITHGLMAASVLVHERPVVSENDRALAFSPLPHVSALWMSLHASLFFGVETVIHNGDTLEAFCQAVQDFKITTSFLQPWITAALAKDPAVKNYDLTSLTKLLCGGASPEKSTLETFEKQYKLIFLDIYASTEAPGLFETTPRITQQGAAGVPARSVELKIVNEDGQEVGAGEQGELYVKGPTVTPGYYRNPKATAEAFDHEGFFKTGDIFTVDEHGIFFFKGRAKEVIKYHRHRICPQDIESVLLSHRKVVDCGVAGVYSEHDATELPRAYVVLADSEDTNEQIQEELQKYVDQLVDDPKRLRGGIVLSEKLPRTVFGKLKRSELLCMEHKNVALIT